MLHCKIAHFKQNWESHPSYLDSRTLHMYHVKHQTWVYVICCNTLFVLAHIDISIIQKSKYFAKLICMYLDFVDQRNAYWIMSVSWSLYPLLQRSWSGGGGILASPDTYIKCAIQMSVRPSVERIVSALYLQQYSSDPFHICTSYQATSEDVPRVMPVSKFTILKFWRIL